ncbi:MAG TPA: IclR family transcriptional regulator [Chloroflexota bacterium]|nr:IclR family transcriptional regulator [Chloroflexota bacterium]
MSTAAHLVSLLDLFVTEQQLGVREMGRRLNVSKSAAQRLVNELAKADLLNKDEDSGRYRLGLRFIEFGFIVQARSELLDAAGATMRWLARLSGESVHLGVLNDLEIVFIARLEGTRSATAAAQMISRSELHTTSLGKAVLAFQPEATLQAVLQRGLQQVGPNTITEAAELRKELARIRRRGYATNMEELRPGLRCVAAPIRTPGGQATAGLTVSGPADRMTRGKLEQLAPAVITAAAQICEALHPLSAKAS